jgi:hypothetical protein
VAQVAAPIGKSASLRRSAIIGAITMTTETQVREPELPIEWQDARVCRCLILRRSRALRLMENLIRNYDDSIKDGSLHVYIEMDNETFYDIRDAFNRK